MAREIQFGPYPTGATLYAVLKRASDGYLRDVVANAWDVPLAADWGDYDIALTEDSTTGHYVATAPSGVALDGTVSVIVYEQAGGSPATTDTYAGEARASVVNIGAISGDSGAADALETMLDGTGGNDLTLAQIVVSPTGNDPAVLLSPSGSGACIELGGSGSGDGIEFSRTGAGDALDANMAAALQQEAEDAITAQASAIADTVLRRTTANAEASSSGDTLDEKSLLGAVAKLVHLIEVSGGTLTVKRADGTTTFFTQTVTSDATAEPITGLGAAS